MPDDISDTTLAVLSKTIRRQRLFLVAALVAALIAAGGLAASAYVKSPAEQAAETRAPTPSVLTAPVLSTVLQNTVIVRGMVVAGGEIAVTPRSGGSGTSSGVLVVSKVTTKAGDEIRAGHVLIEVSGRPIIALGGLVPAYRDLKPGMDGSDVAQLQDALSQLGFSAARDVRGHFGPDTKSAVAAFYQHIGYPVPTTGGPNDAGDRQALQAAADAVTTAQRTVAADKLALQKATDELADAVAAVASTPSRPGGPVSPTSPGRTPGAPVPGPSTAAAHGDSPVQAARDAKATAQISYDYAVQDLDKATRAQSDLVASTGAMVPASEVVFVPSFPVRATKLTAGLGQAVSGSLLTLESGALVVDSVLQPGQNGLVKPGMSVQLDAEALGDQQAAGTVSSIGPLNNGAAPSDANPQGAVASPDADPQGVAQGSGNAGQTVSSPGAQTTPGYPLVMTPVTPLSAAWAGQDVRVTIAQAATAGAVLAVPLSAVSTGADGQASVTVVRADGTQQKMLVTAGGSADGDVQVTPVDPNGLRAGDNVVIGQAQR
ncbi:peptidoglycan hydrolase-like protein with peptidoglycan-binding domain [Catenulispora sp. GP43]|uniref:peptidoglycan-binding protein n=1 Tax=Catenulispora sp. GP43 TaxID=3156263 RepID=UPI003518B2C0